MSLTLVVVAEPLLLLSDLSSSEWAGSALDWSSCGGQAIWWLSITTGIKVELMLAARLCLGGAGRRLSAPGKRVEGLSSGEP